MIRSSVPGVFCAGADLKVNYFYFIWLNLKWKIIWSILHSA
jgi:hypothetical protein